MTTIRAAAAAVVAGSIATAAWADITINKSIDVDDGKTSTSGYSTVNGSIQIGDECIVKGGCNSVNGRIRVGDDSSVRDLRVVNGSIRVGDATTVDGNITTVNGRVTIEEGSSVDGGIDTVNGNIELDGATVSKNLGTVNGNIELIDGAIVEGDVFIRDTNSWSRKKRRISIYLTGDSRIEGDIINEDNKANVTVHIEDGSEVQGELKHVNVEQMARAATD